MNTSKLHSRTVMDLPATVILRLACSNSTVQVVVGLISIVNNRNTQHRNNGNNSIPHTSSRIGCRVDKHQ